jgi:hypothetical protein
MLLIGKSPRREVTVPPVGLHGHEPRDEAVFAIQDTGTRRIMVYNSQSGTLRQAGFFPSQHVYSPRFSGDDRFI